MGQQYPNHIQIWGFYVSVITLSWGIYVPFISLTRVFCLSKFPEMGFYAPAFTLTWVFYIPVFTLTWDIYFPVIKLTRGFYDPIITRTWGFYVPEITLTWLFCVSKQFSCKMSFYCQDNDIVLAFNRLKNLQIVPIPLNPCSYKN